MKIQLIGLFFLLWLSTTVMANINCAALSPNLPSTLWSQCTKQDILALKSTIKTEAPLRPLRKTTHFVSWLKREGFHQSLQLADKVTTRDGYVYTLRYYINGLRDFHTDYNSLFDYPYYIKFQEQFHPVPFEFQWPGFIIALRDTANKRNAQYQVVYQDQSGTFNEAYLPPVGSTLISCNGYSPDELMLKNIIPYFYSYPQYKSTWKAVAPYLFFQQGHNPWETSLTQCMFKTPTGERAYSLQWEKINNDPHNTSAMDDMVNKLNDASFGQAPQKIDISSFDQGQGVWISINSFWNGYDEKGERPYEAALDNIIKQLPTYRNKKTIVFDLRGNEGGQPYYAQAMILSLYGASYLKSLGNQFLWNKNYTIKFRISPASVQMMNNYAEQVRGQGDSLRLAQQLQQAFQQGKKKYFNYHFDLISQNTKASSINPVNAKVYLLTDGHNASACLWFVSAMLEIPNVAQVGKPTRVFDATGFDPDYFLQDTLGGSAISTAMLISPQDYLNKPITPASNHYYYGFMDAANTAQLQQWIIQLNNSR